MQFAKFCQLRNIMDDFIKNVKNNNHIKKYQLKSDLQNCAKIEKNFILLLTKFREFFPNFVNFIFFIEFDKIS